MVSCIQLTIKGSNEQSLFRIPLDYECYLRLLGKYKLLFGIKIFGFCLMPDYVHLVLQSNDPGDLSHLVREVNWQYTRYFSMMHKSKGRLWNEDFKALNIQSFSELVHCLNTIESEPVRSRISNSPIEYLWSSYLYRILSEKNGKKSVPPGSAILDSIALVRGVFTRPSSNLPVAMGMGE